MINMELTEEEADVILAMRELKYLKSKFTYSKRKVTMILRMRQWLYFKYIEFDGNVEKCVDWSNKLVKVLSQDIEIDYSTMVEFDKSLEYIRETFSKYQNDDLIYNRFDGCLFLDKIMDAIEKFIDLNPDVKRELVTNKYDFTSNNHEFDNHLNFDRDTYANQLRCCGQCKHMNYRNTIIKHHDVLYACEYQVPRWASFTGWNLFPLTMPADNCPCYEAR